MGKERLGAKIAISIGKVEKAANMTTSIKQELAPEWATNSIVASANDLAEEISILLTVRRGQQADTFLTKGCVNIPIEFLNKVCNVTCKEKITSVMIYKDYAWVDFDLQEGTFKSGDKILAFIEPTSSQIKKSIKHMPKKN